MARYAIGDIQGCYSEFCSLLSLIQFNPSSDKVYLVGDLVNRGPQSLEVLRLVKSLSPTIEVVLGNHDLHLLACWAGGSKVKELDTLEAILNAPDVDDLLHWLRTQPLIIDLPDCFICHAGINPTISIVDSLRIADNCSKNLSSDGYHNWLQIMYGNAPTTWDAAFTADSEFRFGINSFTRMRMLDRLALEFKYKGEILDAPSQLTPWYMVQSDISKRIVFGHWSTLGLMVNQQFACLDTGCIWGGQLTALCLDDGRLYQVPAEHDCQSLFD
ncbi:symmetrical bis(5'-nucleosyl)-tetraphosphatase [Deefgea sp. CFH1-16]|uniref:symmetrical bis(5'-nucleosyl)-tetraphosphatase n=1 Tax=Deefgea sp. CFH1-16 TaxID=2675457 RepID=UPI0015F602F3|nr:symmetrical bis(5'-nucleosyl)-tetraphosphatase [Deefgea sp. CFH1-16]MBM5573942.1 symmetrical bis(5'-nucleosyl)-tetraphosphatase [Deefgea sp. CFH1-16]